MTKKKKIGLTTYKAEARQMKNSLTTWKAEKKNDLTT